MADNQSINEKLDLILSTTMKIHQKVEQQNQDIAQLRSEMRSLEQLVNEMTKKNRNQALLAGGIGGGIVAVSIELIRWKLGG